MRCTTVATVALAVLGFAGQSEAFAVQPRSALQRTHLAAVASDARSSIAATILVVNGKKVNAKAGTNLGAALQKAGFKPNYSCKKGECNSCVVSVGGTRMKACIGKVPPEPKLKSLQEKGLEVR